MKDLSRTVRCIYTQEGGHHARYHRYNLYQYSLCPDRRNDCGLSARDLATRWLVGAALWGAILVSLAAIGAFVPGATGRIPGPGLAFIAAILALFGAFGLSARFRNALLAIPMPVLVGLNIVRVGGVLFLLLLAAQVFLSTVASGAE